MSNLWVIRIAVRPEEGLSNSVFFENEIFCGFNLESVASLFKTKYQCSYLKTFHLLYAIVWMLLHYCVVGPITCFIYLVFPHITKRIKQYYVQKPLSYLTHYYQGLRSRSRHCFLCTLDFDYPCLSITCAYLVAYTGVDMYHFLFLPLP